MSSFEQAPLVDTPDTPPIAALYEMAYTHTQIPGDPDADNARDRYAKLLIMPGLGVEASGDTNGQYSPTYDQLGRVVSSFALGRDTVALGAKSEDPAEHFDTGNREQRPKSLLNSAIGQGLMRRTVMEGTIVVNITPETENVVGEIVSYNGGEVSPYTFDRLERHRMYSRLVDEAEEMFPDVHKEIELADGGEEARELPEIVEDIDFGEFEFNDNRADSGSVLLPHLDEEGNLIGDRKSYLLPIVKDTRVAHELFARVKERSGAPVLTAEELAIDALASADKISDATVQAELELSPWKERYEEVSRISTIRILQEVGPLYAEGQEEAGKSFGQRHLEEAMGDRLDPVHTNT